MANDSQVCWRSPASPSCQQADGKHTQGANGHRFGHDARAVGNQHLGAGRERSGGDAAQRVGDQAVEGNGLAVAAAGGESLQRGGGRVGGALEGDRIADAAGGRYAVGPSDGKTNGVREITRWRRSYCRKQTQPTPNAGKSAVRASPSSDGAAIPPTVRAPAPAWPAPLNPDGASCPIATSCSDPIREAR
jgi:hypothetical protein